MNWSYFSDTQTMGQTGMKVEIVIYMGTFSCGAFYMVEVRFNSSILHYSYHHAYYLDFQFVSPVWTWGKIPLGITTFLPIEGVHQTKTWVELFMLLEIRVIFFLQHKRTTEIHYIHTWIMTRRVLLRISPPCILKSILFLHPVLTVSWDWF